MRVRGGAGLKVTVILAALVMVAVAVAILVGSVTDVAVMVTVPPEGTVAGAVKVVVAPLAVCAELSEPQLDPLQLTAQSTPAFAASLATAALIVACAPTCKEVGGDRLKVTEIGVRMVNVAEAVFVGSAVEVAVMVTEFPAGMEVGAVKVVVAPLAVCVGLNEPQVELGQLTVQSTPKFALSLVTVALSVV